jgi:peptide/nickel transport system ATP-binding protein
LKHQVLALVQWIRDRRNIGIVFITHDLRVAAQICDTIIVMQNGAIIEAAPAKEVLLHAAGRFLFSRIFPRGSLTKGAGT